MSLSVSITIDASVDPVGVRLLDDKIVVAMRRLMAGMKRRAERLVPKRTRALMRSLQVEVVRESDYVVGILSAGGGSVDYALYVERGTSRARAQPYLRPALMQTRGIEMTAGGM